MDIIIGIIIGIAAAAGGFVVLKKKSSREEATPEPPPRQLQHRRTVEPPTHHELFRLQLQDVVSCLGTDYIIEGRIDMEDEGDVWTSYMLADGHDIVWLCVEDEDELEVSLWTEVEDCPIPEKPPEVVEYQGNRFQLIERGQAKASQLGETGQKSGKSVRYFDYNCAGQDVRLAIEIWRGETEVYTGHDISASSVEIFPHDGRAL